jgi:hypothetical protein
MNKPLQGVLLATAALGLAWPLACRATDTANYVFKVPVNISNMGPGHQVHVKCSTYKGSVLVGLLEGARVPVPLDASGSFTGSVEVRVDYAPMSDGSWVVQDSYQCWLLVNVDANNVQTKRPPPSRSVMLAAVGKL